MRFILCWVLNRKDGENKQDVAARARSRKQENIKYHQSFFPLTGIFKLCCSAFPLRPTVQVTVLCLALCRWTAAHHQAEAMVPVRCAGGEVRLDAWRRRSVHSLPSAHAGDGAWEEGLGRGMPQPPLAQLLATNTDQSPPPLPSYPHPPDSWPKHLPLVAAFGTPMLGEAGNRWGLPSCIIPHIHFMLTWLCLTSTFLFPKGM